MKYSEFNQTGSHKAFIMFLLSIHGKALVFNQWLFCLYVLLFPDIVTERFLCYAALCSNLHL